MCQTYSQHEWQFLKIWYECVSKPWSKTPDRELPNRVYDYQRTLAQALYITLSVNSPPLWNFTSTLCTYPYSHASCVHVLYPCCHNDIHLSHTQRHTRDVIHLQYTMTYTWCITQWHTPDDIHLIHLTYTMTCTMSHILWHSPEHPHGGLVFTPNIAWSYLQAYYVDHLSLLFTTASD